MPYRLRKAPKKELYWVVDDTGKKYSHEPIPKERADAQRRALYASEHRQLKGGMDGAPKKLAPCEGEAHTGECSLTREELDGLKEILEDEDVSKDDVIRVIKTLRITLSDEADKNLLQEAANAIQGKGTRAETINRAINYLMEIINRVFPRSGGGRTHKESFFKKYDVEDKSYSLKDLSEISKVPLSILQEVYNRGVGAYKTQPQSVRLKHSFVKNVDAPMKSKLSKEQWGMARVYSFLNGNPKHDNDLRKNLKGGGPMPDRNLLQQIATQSYQASPAPQLGNFTLLTATPTLKFYGSGNTIIVGIRGTKPTDPEDVKADAMIGIGQLENAPRFQTDLQTLLQIQQQYPPNQYDYYGVGHSLGGAILDMFLKKGMIKNGISYNPAVQPGDFSSNLPNQRIYQEGDPLYAIMGRHIKGVEVRKPKSRGFFDSLIRKIPYAGKAYDLYQNHALDNFVGGRKASQKFIQQLEEVGLTPDEYLKEAQRRAKAHDYPANLLGFADDGEHKLAIPDSEGRIVKFGRVGYGDHLIWSHLEESGSVPKGTASQKQSRFHKSHKAIKGDWKKNPFSPNNLALRILW